MLFILFALFVIALVLLLPFIARALRLHYTTLATLQRNYWAKPRASGTSRIIATLTTTPVGISQLEPTLKSLLDQSVQLDDIYLFVPQRFKNSDTEPPYTLPDFLEGLSAVTVVRVPTDHGPITKLFPALQQEQDPDCRIIFLDDDMVYQPRLFETLVAASQEYPDNAVAMSGIVLDNGSENFNCKYLSRVDQDIDVVEGYNGVLVRKRFFGPDSLEINKLVDFGGPSGLPREAFFVDDTNISGFLHRKGVTRTMLRTPVRLGSGFFNLPLLFFQTRPRLSSNENSSRHNDKITARFYFNNSV